MSASPPAHANKAGNCNLIEGIFLTRAKQWWQCPMLKRGEGCSRNCNQPGKMCLILRPESNTAHEQSERISERECITTASRTGQYIFLCFILFRWLLSWLVWKSLYYLHTTTHGAKSLKWISWWWCVCVCVMVLLTESIKTLRRSVRAEYTWNFGARLTARVHIKND